MIEEIAIQKCIGDIFTENQMLERIRDLCFLGSRFSGTESEKQAQEHLVKFLVNLNLKPIEWEFEYQGWRRGTCSFQIEDQKAKDIPAISLVLAPSTLVEGIEGLIICGAGGSEKELEKIKSEAKEAFLLVHSGNTEEGWLHRRIKYANAVNIGAKAFIFANHNPGQLFPTGSVRSNRLGEIPAIGISKENYSYINELIKLKGSLKGKIEVSNISEKTVSKHIIWEIEGENPEEVIVIGGHLDGHDLAQGATDNAGGIATLLEITRLFIKYNVKPRRTLRFIAFAVEEFGVVGSTIYANKEDLQNIVAMVNLDGIVGHIPKHISCNGYGKLCKTILKLKENLLYEPSISSEIVSASDNYPFFCKGIPSLCIYGENPDPKLGRGYGHTSADTFDKIDPLDAKLSLAFALVFISHFSNIERLPEKLAQREIIEILQNNKLEENLKILEKWPFK
ncbi:Aminopeptidase YwaD [subsurface metagenome]